MTKKPSIREDGRVERRGGARSAAGRKPGSKNKRTLVKYETQQKIIKSGKSPLEFFANIINDEEIPLAVRLEAARAAAPYIHQRLGALELTGKGGGPVHHKLQVEVVESPRANEPLPPADGEDDK